MSDSDLKRSLVRVFGEHRHNVATIEVWSDRGNFHLQYAGPMGDQSAVWNLCADPPGRPPERFTVVDAGPNFTVVEATEATPTEAMCEAEEIIEHVGGPDAEYAATKTYRTINASQVPTLRELVQRATQSIRGVLS